ncbi:hypothetical protein [Bacillus sp. MMSF_3328]|uniref:hypothetical protein n=1 Tax=Bacillus sp. MMSF_3328 TaxID=3047080 RepID=UPI00273F8D91|nr:hypothetical protein [Bacillus sp. MMSF_3328]
MAREKGKGITGFQDVADENSNVNSNINTEINPSVKFNVDPLEKLQEENPAKELTTVLKGIYFDSEVAEVIDLQAKRLGRGGKSQLVNDIVKSYFITKGLL